MISVYLLYQSRGKNKAVFLSLFFDIKKRKWQLDARQADRDHSFEKSSSQILFLCANRRGCQLQA